MSGFGLNKTVTANVTPSTIVFFDKVTPTTAGVVFDPNTPATTDILYISSVNASTWIWDGSAYISYAAPSVSSTEWYLYGTTIDAGSNKTASIQRSGAIFVSVDSYFYDVRVGRGNGSISSNTIVGDKCLLLNTTGTKITAVGYGALQSNTASNNTAFGWGSLNFNSSGANNTGVGSEALQINITGSNNSGVGYRAGRFLANGSTSNTTSQNSVFLGSETRSLTNNDTNQIVIGYLALGKGSNTVQLGNTSITNTYLQGAVTVNNAFTLPTTDGTANYFLKTNGSGTVSWGAAGGLTYFTEAQNTTAPNATVPVDSLTAVTGTTNGDFAILPKGTGAFIVGHIPDGTITNGGKRGAGAVEIRSAESMNYYAGASGVNSISIGKNTQSTQTGSVAIGLGCNSTGTGAIAMGYGNDVIASGSQSTAIQGASSATNTLSFAIQGGSATGAGAFAGNYSTASGTNSLALAGTAYEGATASGTNSVSIGKGTLSNASHSISMGNWSSSKATASKLSVGSFIDIGPYLQGSSQLGLSSSLANTTTNTAIELSTQGGTVICLTLQNNEAIRVRGSIIGKQTASTNITCYDFDCVIVRGTTAASTVIKVSNMNLVWDDIICTVLPTLTADTTNGGLSVKSGGKLTTTIKWSCRIDSTESILA